MNNGHKLNCNAVSFITENALKPDFETNQRDKTNTTLKKLFTFLLVLVLCISLSANNVTISNLSLTGKNTGSHYTMVQFDISWENSWRTSTAESNWDAAWVFVKYRIAVANGGNGLWKHAWLNNRSETLRPK